MSSWLAAAETRKPVLFNSFAAHVISKVKYHTKCEKQVTRVREK